MRGETLARRMSGVSIAVLLAGALLCVPVDWALPVHGASPADWWKPYSHPCTEREDVFEFTERPVVRLVGRDKYEITFAVRAACDVTVSIVDPDPAKELVKGRGIVVRHLASGVLGPNAPKPFQKNSLSQTIYWDGKDDLDEYVKAPEKLTVRVSLGLKPEFDQLLGTGTPYNLPGVVNAVTASPQGVYVFVYGIGSRGHYTIREFDHDGRYVKTVFPPPANLLQERLGGLWFVEYEPGKRSLIGASIDPDNIGRSNWLPYGVERGGPYEHRPFAFGNRIFLSSSGFTPANSAAKLFKPALHWVYTDGSTDVKGMNGREYFRCRRGAENLQLAVSPDGRWVYVVGLPGQAPGAMMQAVARFALDGAEQAEVFVGDARDPGSGDGQLNGPCDVDCDSEGRVYVADQLNNRVAIFAADGRHLKALPVRAPLRVQVHRKTGAIYVIGAARLGAPDRYAITKFKSYPDCGRETYWEDILFPAVGAAPRGEGTGPIFVLDSWTPKPRLWMAMANARLPSCATKACLGIWEEAEGRWVRVLDFDERAKKEAGARYPGRRSGSCSGNAHVTCDPTTERAYVRRHKIFDLVTGSFLGVTPETRNTPLAEFREEGPGTGLGFDRRGYMHVEYAYSHIARIDPRGWTRTPVVERFQQTEVPYDYGEELAPWKGVLLVPPVGRHPCGIGVNMRGDVANVLSVEVIPKFDEAASFYNAMLNVDSRAWGKLGGTWSADQYNALVRNILDREKRGQETYSIRREPGVPIGGGVIWTWDRNGERRDVGAVIAGHRTNGVQIDDDGNLYFSNCRYRMLNGKPFLAGRASRAGTTETATFFTGTYLKTRGKNVRFLCKDSPLAMDVWPEREPDLSGPWLGGYTPDVPVWVEGTEWLYAGASPMKPGACMCPQIRAHLDWYKRSYVPEYYRHSIGILDTAGNLVLHVGRYGNFDSGAGADSPIKLGGDEIATTSIRHISGTDNYICFEDWEQRLVSLKLNYHAEATAPIVGASQ